MLSVLPFSNHEKLVVLRKNYLESLVVLEQLMIFKKISNNYHIFSRLTFTSRIRIIFLFSIVIIYLG
uniref:Uncharacterized protein n=1 Tax=Heterorhabditis bacteriophora TaxID=37862 RepID=A0A1I7WLS5_HETBA